MTAVDESMLWLQISPGPVNGYDVRSATSANPTLRGLLLVPFSIATAELRKFLAGTFALLSSTAAAPRGQSARSLSSAIVRKLANWHAPQPLDACCP